MGLISGETGNTDHAILIGHSSQDYCNFYEYGAVWNFYKSQSGTNTLIAKIAASSSFAGDVSAPSFTASSYITSPYYISTIATGTAPLTVASTTKVTNLNADMIDGYHVATAGTTAPWSMLVCIGSDGVSEMGKYIDFHYDNTTKSDYSTRIKVAGNNNNIVTLPTKTGTLALIGDNVASASKLETARTISLVGNTTGSGSFDGSSDLSITTKTSVLSKNTSFLNSTVG